MANSGKITCPNIQAKEGNLGKSSTFISCPLQSANALLEGSPSWSATFLPSKWALHTWMLTQMLNPTRNPSHRARRDHHGHEGVMLAFCRVLSLLHGNPWLRRVILYKLCPVTNLSVIV